MATIQAVAVKRSNAKDRIAAAFGAMGAPFGLNAPVLPTQGHDAAFIHAQQLEVLADWAEAYLEASALEASDEMTERAAALRTSDATDYAEMTDQDLWNVVAARKLDVGSVSRDELIALLEAWDEAHASDNGYQPPAYERMKKEDLQTLLDERGLTPLESNGADGSPLKQDLINTLKADDEAQVKAQAQHGDAD